MPKVWLAPEEIRRLRSLVRFRAQKVKQRTILREHRLRPPAGINAWTRSWLAWFQALDLDETTAFLRDEYLEELQHLNDGLRVVLVQAAQRLINFSPHWRKFAARLKQKGKPHNVIVAAVANRWLRRLSHPMQPDQRLAS